MYYKIFYINHQHHAIQRYIVLEYVEYCIIEIVIMCACAFNRETVLKWYLEHGINIQTYIYAEQRQRKIKKKKKIKQKKQVDGE